MYPPVDSTAKLSGARHARSTGPDRKKRVQEEKRQTQVESTMESLNISSWPEIPVIHISTVAHDVLERFVGTHMTLPLVTEQKLVF